MESETEIKQVKVSLVCPYCILNMDLETQDPQAKSIFWYKCSRCKSTAQSEKRYPYIKYVPKK